MLRKHKLFLGAASAAVVLGCFTTAQADLRAWWKLDGDVLDSSGNANTGALIGAPLPTFTNDVSPSLGAGMSLSLTGGTGRAEVPDSNFLDFDTALSVSAWVKAIGTGFDAIVSKTPSNGSLSNHAGNYELRIDQTTRKLNFGWQRGGANDTVGAVSAGAVPNGSWSHVAVTVQKNGLSTFYINGTASGTFTATNFGAVNTNPLMIGNRADLFTVMDGSIDDVRMYNEVLSASAIAALAAVPPPYGGLSPILAKASSEFTGDGRLAIHAINGNGIVGKSHVAGPAGGTMWLTSGSDTAPKYEMDLGGVYSLSDVRLYNYNENANATCCLDRGVKDVDIYLAGQDGVYGALPVTTLTFARAPGTVTDFSELKALAGQGRYIKMDIKSNYGDPSFFGFSEVKVNGAPVTGLAPVPTVIKSVSSNLSGFDRNANYVVNGAGRLFGDKHSVGPDGTMWLSQGDLPGAPTDSNPEIVFDLGSVMDIKSMKVWNYNEYRPDLPARTAELLGRGIAVADILVAGEDLVFTPFRLSQSFDRAPEVGDTADFGQIIDLLGVHARYIKLDIHSNHNGKNFDDPLSNDLLNNFAGLSEVQFFQVPEACIVWTACRGRDHVVWPTPPSLSIAAAFDGGTVI